MLNCQELLLTNKTKLIKQYFSIVKLHYLLQAVLQCEFRILFTHDHQHLVPMNGPRVSPVVDKECYETNVW